MGKLQHSIVAPKTWKEKGFTEKKNTFLCIVYHMLGFIIGIIFTYSKSTTILFEIHNKFVKHVNSFRCVDGIGYIYRSIKNSNMVIMQYDMLDIT